MTSERFKRISDMLAKRQLDLTVCMLYAWKDVHKPHSIETDMTPERFKRISDMLAQRQLDLTVCMPGKTSTSLTR